MKNLYESIDIVVNSEPDKQGHKYGPDAKETHEAVCIGIERISSHVCFFNSCCVWIMIWTIY